MYGREPNELSPYNKNLTTNMNADTYHVLIRQNFSEAREYIEAKMAQHHCTPKDIRFQTPFSIGQPVWLSCITNRVADKLNKRWDGNWMVRGSPSLVTADISISNGLGS
ncbi:hypothetical protein LOD99_11823 [Oopsacas minuta]|uniref:Uncharacterized protein n=1 Tax=Oopsacas minuta TaxID=111878 RepID=A0AAV7JKX1_9METZ|nr:hypothetical protein LOD99_11823 [Oopsacas minuta]